ncbi:D-alanyl-D-alanine carboxypeptidase [Lachnospiraceae bacterium KM106-2]|nr:D-alanyl-D-alanine carboxypeptidase [Lachnospiraceae bacterium KM106-2]
MKNKKSTVAVVLLLIVLFAKYPCDKMIASLNTSYPTKLRPTKLLNQDLDKTLVVKSKEKPAELSLTARGAVLIDADNNRILYQKNAKQEMPMASTTKIMTCIVALENGNLNDKVTFSKYAAGMPDVQLNAKSGQTFYLKDLLYSLMLESHNDTAVAIAEHIGGSVEGFATMMNAKAKELGLKHTSFVTPNGLDSEKHYTTAYDLARIASYAIKNKTFVEITNTPSHEFHEINSNQSFLATNKNRFLFMMDGAIGVKTGFTNNAGYCFVGGIRRGDKTFISVVLGAGWPPHKTYKWADTKKLMDYGLDNYKKKSVYDGGVKFSPIYVENGKNPIVTLSINGEVNLLLSDAETVRVEYDIPTVIQGPMKAGTAIGCACYYVDNKLYCKIPIFVDNDVEVMTLRDVCNSVYALFTTNDVSHVFLKDLE